MQVDSWSVFIWTYVQQSSADEAVVRVSQVVKKKGEGPDRRCSDHLVWTLQRLGKETRTPRLTHAVTQKGQQQHTVCLDARRCNNTHTVCNWEPQREGRQVSMKGDTHSNRSWVSELRRAAMRGILRSYTLRLTYSHTPREETAGHTLAAGAHPHCCGSLYINTGTKYEIDSDH